MRPTTSLPASMRTTPPRVTASKLFMNRLVEQTRVPTVWITNNLDRLGPAVVRRINLVVRFPRPGVAVRPKNYRARSPSRASIDLDVKAHRAAGASAGGAGADRKRHPVRRPHARFGRRGAANSGRRPEGDGCWRDRAAAGADRLRSLAQPRRRRSAAPWRKRSRRRRQKPCRSACPGRPARENRPMPAIWRRSLVLRFLDKRYSDLASSLSASRRRRSPPPSRRPPTSAPSSSWTRRTRCCAIAARRAIPGRSPRSMRC